MRRWIVLAVIVLLAGCAGGPPTRDDGTPLTEQDAGPPPASAQELVHDYLRSYLKDPSSAQVEGLAGPTFITVKASLLGPSTYGWGICFDVNGKNSYGAYVGFSTMALIWRNGQIVRTYGTMRDNMFDQGLAQGACRLIRQGHR